MTSANIAHRTTARPALRPSADELDRYLATHTVPQAAKRWQVNERTVRKWRSRADMLQPTVLAQDERNTPTAIDSVPTFSPTADDVAGVNSMWLDPWSGELRLVPPGVHRKTWEAERIAARDRHKAAVQAALTPTPIGPPLDTMSSRHDTVSADPTSTESTDPASAPIDGQDLDAIFEAVQSQETSGPERPLHYDQMTARPSAPVVITRIVRLPAEMHQRGIYDRLAGIDATSIMGPELGLIVAVILIAMTFWGLG